MIRTLARFWAKRRYVWKELMESSFHALNAAAALARAAQKRQLVTKFTQEAQEIEDNIAREEQSPE
jgi:hypothetical protein